MPWLVLGLGAVAFGVSLLATWLATRLGRRLGTLDSPGVPGQVKARPRPVPNVGGVGIVLALLSAILAALLLAPAIDGPHRRWTDPASAAAPAWALVAAIAWLHALGLVDDRRPLGPRLKMALMAVPALAVPMLADTRLLTLLDALPGGWVLSVAATALWLLAITNAMNFLDNMDGLCAGVAAIAGLFLALAMVLAGQWLVAGLSACLAGACLGFLPHNFPRARVFMGDGGSLVLGFVLGFLAVRGTYIGQDPGAWWRLLLPVLVLAVPLYDLVTVVALRLSQGRSPLVGDLQHVSHRLAGIAQRAGAAGDRADPVAAAGAAGPVGLGRLGAVLVLWGFAVIAGAAGLLLVRVDGLGAAVLAVQAAAMVAVMALLEFWPRSVPAGRRSGAS